MNNEHFSISEMIEMQNILQEKYKDKWSKIEPSTGKEKLLWMIGDILNCYGITEKELKDTYIKKFNTNMNRW